MKALTKWIMVLISVLFLGGSAWAYNAQMHVRNADGGRGDLVLFKSYIALEGGWATKFSITNTAKASVVAKVIVRSSLNSAELLDFLIYLSPYDMWTGKIYVDAEGVTRFYSEDGSCRNEKNGWASPTDPLNIALANGYPSEMPFCPDDSKNVGYVYVMQSAMSLWNSTVDTPKINFTKPGVSKDDIKTWYDASAAGTSYVFQVAAGGVSGLSTPSGWRWISPLTGYQVLSNEALGLFSSAIRAVGLADYQNMEFLTVRQTQRIGVDANNTLAEVEAAYAIINGDLPYVQTEDEVTIHILTLPTKYTTDSSAHSCNSLYFSYASPFFSINGTGPNLAIQPMIYDVNEKASSPGEFSPAPSTNLRAEVNVIGVPVWNLDNNPEGWILYPFNFSTFSEKGDTSVVVENAAGDPISYTGVPVLTTALFFGGLDSYSIEGAWSSNTVKQGVTPETGAGGTVIPFYQYATVTNP
jgi:hypothetical protein